MIEAGGSIHRLYYEIINFRLCILSRACVNIRKGTLELWQKEITARDPL